MLMMLMIVVLTLLTIGCVWTLVLCRCKWRSDITKHHDENGDQPNETDPLLGPFTAEYQRRKASINILIEPPIIQLLRHGLRVSLVAASLCAARCQPSAQLQQNLDSKKRRRVSTSPTPTARSSIRRKLSKGKSSEVYHPTSASSRLSTKPSLQQLFDLPPLTPSTPSPQPPSCAAPTSSDQITYLHVPTSIFTENGVTNSRNVKRSNVSIPWNSTRHFPRPMAARHWKEKSIYTVNSVAIDPVILPSGVDCSSFQDEAIFELTVPDLGRLKLIEHSPAVFIKLRETFSLTHDDLCSALSRSLILQRTEGQSGSFFLKTANRRFLFKTLRGSEHESLKSFLPAYLHYMANHPESLLPRYFGCYTFERLSNGERVLSGTSLLGSSTTSNVDTNLGTKFTVIAMLSVYDTDLDIHQRFDFKGSNVGRQASQGLMNYFIPPSASSSTMWSNDESLHGSNIFRDSEITLKELDFGRLLIMGKAGLLNVGADNKTRLLTQLEQDMDLLKTHSFMDYSLLIGIHRHHRLEALDTMLNIATENGTFNSKRVPGDTWPRHTSIYSSIRSIRSAIPHQAATFLMWLLNAGSSSLHGEHTPPSSTGASTMDDDDNLVDESLPFHKRFHGGLKSADSNHPEVEYEVYFIGLIDILQKFNLAKWFERGLKRQASFLTTTETWRVGDLTTEGATSLLSKPMQSDYGTRSPLPTSPTLRSMSPLSGWDGVEHSVEEPQRYASRLLDYIRGILE
ncbi:hypothetical protein SeLEV6574_g02580 [Synchytrium endobioticum]|nr:hypothetical protein SeLEV6574_g02580 [Synchytrium endobioticum]